MEQAPAEIVSPSDTGEQQPGLLPRAGRFLWQFLRELLSTVLPAVLIALTINLFMAQATVVQGQSMEPTLYNNERVIVEKVTYQFFHGPRRGDIVVLRPPGQDDLLIKRVVALAGETVEVRNGRVYIDGILLEEPWTDRFGGPDYPPTVVPPLMVFVLGDNRAQSNDSRSFGTVPLDDVIGRAWVIYWPLENVGLVR